MKTGSIVVVIASLTLPLMLLIQTGCGILPKPVEIGQKKVKNVPEKSQKAVELEKQAADLTARKTEEARDVILRENVTNALPSITDARDAAYGLRYSLGAPAKPWDSSGSEIALRLGYLENKLDKALAEHRKEIAPTVGKKIEGTGWIQIPYFLWLALIAGALLFLWFALKVASVFYPPVGLGAAGLSMAGRAGAWTVKKGFEQVVSGAEGFKQAIERSGFDQQVKEQVLDMLRRHQMVSQDSDVQELIRRMTK